MPGLSDLLDRFRPAGAPGPAAAAAVPADPGAATRRELAAVFAVLAEAERECARLRDAARSGARQRMLDADREAAALIQAARAQAPAVRARVAAESGARAAGELADLTAQAEAEVATVRARTALRLPALIDAALVHVRVQLSTLAGDEAVAGLRPGTGVGP